MTFKSVVEIEVNDESFKQFQTAFDDYQKTLKESSKEWKALGAASAGMAKQYQKLSDLTQQVADGAGNAAENQDKMRRATDGTVRSMSNLARGTREVARGVASVTGSLLRWTGVVTALSAVVAAGGLFGIDRMVAGVVGRQREAAGYSSKTGPVEAFKINFGQLLDAQGIMSSVNAVQQSADKTPFIGLGMKSDQWSGETPDVARNSLMALRRWLKRHPGATSQEWDAFQLTKLFSSADIQRVRGASDKDFNARMSEYNADRTSLGFSGTGASAMATTGRQFDRSVLQIENAVAQSLMPLMGPLKSLSAAIVQVTKQILGSGAFKEGIQAVTVGIKDFANYLLSPEFKADMADVLDALEDFARGLKKITNMTFGPSTDESMMRTERRFGMAPGSMRQIEASSGLYFGHGRLPLKDPRAALSDAFDDALRRNSNRIGAAMRTGPDALRMVLGDVVSQAGVPANQKNTAVQNMMIRVYAPPGSSTDVSVNGLKQ